MIFTESPLKGAHIIEPEPVEDERGMFARSWCQKEFSANGLNPKVVQCNISFNSKRGTLRGMHYQVSPFEEAKVVRCTRGAVYDVIIDLRPQSGTFKQWFSIRLTAENHKMLYVPEGFAHGFQALQDQTEVFYQMSQFYSPEHSKGVMWNDPSFGIQWPEGPRIVSKKDQEYPDFPL